MSMKHRGTLCVVTAALGVAWLTMTLRANTVTLTGTIAFGTLDGGPQDHDGAANGVFTVDDGDLIIAGTITCNDAPPLGSSASACPIAFAVSGHLVMEPGSAILAENRRSSGNGGHITLSVGGDLVLNGTAGSIPGAIISSSRIKDSAARSGKAGNITALIGGNAELQAGSIVSASSFRGAAGAITIDADGRVAIGGLVAAGPRTLVEALRTQDRVFKEVAEDQAGGPIKIKAGGLVVSSTGAIVSQGEDLAAPLVLLEACGIEIRGLVASISEDGKSEVKLRSGAGILVDGRDVGQPLPNEGRFGQVRSDVLDRSSNSGKVSLFANGPVEVHGPAPTKTLFSVTANPHDQDRSRGGLIRVVSLDGTLTASGNAFQAGLSFKENEGGQVVLHARDAMLLDGAVIRAAGDTLARSSKGKGGVIEVRSFSAAGSVSWANGIGDVRPTGAASKVKSSSRGKVAVLACGPVNVPGTVFPSNGTPGPAPSFPPAACTLAAPTLPAAEPPLPDCAPPDAVDEGPADASAPGDPFHTAFDTALDSAASASTPSLLANDDVGMPAGTIVSFGGGNLGGTVEGNSAGATVSFGSGGSLAVNADGEFVFTPTTGFTGLFTFQYRLENGVNADDATVTLAVGDRPVANPDEYNMAGVIPFVVSAPGVLLNDAGSAISVTEVMGSAANVGQPTPTTDNPAINIVTVSADGSLTFTQQVPANTIETITYRVGNGFGNSGLGFIVLDVPTSPDLVWKRDRPSDLVPGDRRPERHAGARRASIGGLHPAVGLSQRPLSGEVVVVVPRSVLPRMGYAGRWCRSGGFFFSSSCTI
jgi:hypothetical protein